MKIKKCLSVINCFIFVFCLPFLSNAQTTQSQQDSNTTQAQQNSTTSQIVDISAQYAVMVDANSGNIMYSKNAFTKAYPASTTKLMTAILFYEKYKDDLNKTFTVDSIVNSTPPRSSIMNLKVDEVVSAKQLLMGLMLVSGNDAALMMAKVHSGSVEEFVKLMNQRAKDYDMSDTNFVNPHGFHNENHYTTAYDFSKLARQYITYDYLMEIAKTNNYTIPATSQQEERTLKNSNRLVSTSTEHKSYYLEYATGLKTGYTDKAQNCLVSSADNGTNSVILVSFCSKDTNLRFADAKKMLMYGLTNFTPTKVYPYIKNTQIDINITDLNLPEYQYGKIDCIVQINKNEIMSIDKDIANQLEDSEIQTRFSPKLDIAYPIQEGDVVGYIEYIAQGRTIYSTRAISAKHVNKRIIPKMIDTIKFAKAQNYDEMSVLSGTINLAIDLKRASDTDQQNDSTNNTSTNKETPQSDSNDSTTATTKKAA